MIHMFSLTNQDPIHSGNLFFVLNTLFKFLSCGLCHLLTILLFVVCLWQKYVIIALILLVVLAIIALAVGLSVGLPKN